ERLAGPAPAGGDDGDVEGAGGLEALLGLVGGGPAGQGQDQQKRVQGPAGVFAPGRPGGPVGLPEDLGGQKMPQAIHEGRGRAAARAAVASTRHKPFLRVGLGKVNPDYGETAFSSTGTFARRSVTGVAPAPSPFRRGSRQSEVGWRALRPHHKKSML